MGKNTEENRKKYYKALSDAEKEKWFKYLDVIVSSGEIRRRFFTRCKELEIDPYKLAIKVGITPTSFKLNYVGNPEPQCTRSFDQRKFLKMIELVGIDIKVMVILKPFSEVYVRLKKEGIIKDE